MDDEVKGEGNHYSFGNYGYDARIGRRWNRDPLADKAPNESPYVSFGNNPIFYIDPNGKFKIPYHWEITNTAFQRSGVSCGSEALLDVLIGATLDSDIAGAFSDYHFDGRKDFKSVKENWQRIYGIVARLSDDIGPGNKAWGGFDMSELGKTLHNVQDFYAHSNYIELYIEYYGDTHDGQVPDVTEIPTYVVGKEDKKFKKEYLKPRLKTGEFHTLTYLTGQDVEKTHEDGEVHHDDIAKDNPEMGVTILGTNGSINTFKAAKEVATRHSEEIIKTVFE